MSSHRAVLAALALLPASGCLMIPRYERPAAPVADGYPGAPPGAGEGKAAELPWRSFVTDARITRLVELALEENRDLRAATLRVEQVRAQYQITRSASLPEVDASGTYTRSRSGGVTASRWSAGVGIVSYELDLFGRVRSLNAQALEQYLAKEEAQRSARLALVAEVATAELTLRQAGEQVELAAQTLEAARESARITRVAFDAGASSELDLRTAEGQVETADVDLLTYRMRRAQAENALVLLVGRPLPPDLPPPRPLAQTAFAEVPAGLPSELVQRRPDILEAEHTLQAANASVGAARAAFFPSIGLTASAGRASDALSGLFAAGSGTWSFAPQITVPIFTGGRNRANLEAAEVATRIEVATYEKAIQTAFREVADALAAVGIHAEVVEAERRAIAAQQRRLELATLRYRQGEDTYLNVLSAQRDLYGAQEGLLQAELDHGTSQIALYQALGGGWR